MTPLLNYNFIIVLKEIALNMSVRNILVTAIQWKNVNIIEVDLLVFNISDACN
jgi:hypothetical protein